jgi:hypothetical protein
MARRCERNSPPANETRFHLIFSALNEVGRAGEPVLYCEEAEEELHSTQCSFGLTLSVGARIALGSTRCCGMLPRAEQTGFACKGL